MMNPLLDHYAARRATGIEKLQHLKGPVILVANHASHMDTPIILSALPRRLRKRTAVAAAADYFYRYRITAWLASLLVGVMIFLWVPMLHIPRAIADPYTNVGNEWASVFEATAFSGMALMLAVMSVREAR